MLRSFLALVFITLPVNRGRADSPPAKLPETFDPAAVDHYVAHRVRERGFIGLSLAVVRDGQIVLARGYGQVALNGAPVDPETAFAIGSVTKQFACACILLLAE